MILVGSMVPNFKQILFHFFCFLYQGHMGFIAISEISHFGLPKTIFTFSKNFGKSWASKAKYRKTGFGPFFKPCYCPKLKITFFKKIKIVSTVIV